MSPLSTSLATMRLRLAGVILSQVNGFAEEVPYSLSLVRTMPSLTVSELFSNVFNFMSPT